MRWGAPSKILKPPGFIEPCIPTGAKEPPRGESWIHEIKHDGYRLIVRGVEKRVRLYTRRGRDWTERFPRIVDAVSGLRLKSAVLDGEAVICATNGIADFDALHSRRLNEKVFLYCFDLLELDGTDLREERLERRKARLEKLLRKCPEAIRYTEHMSGDSGLMFKHACKLGLEGIVSKRRDSPYRSGRSKNWLKIKNPDSAAMRRLEEDPPT